MKFDIPRLYRKAAAVTANRQELLKYLAEKHGLNEFELECAGFQITGRYLERYGYNYLEDGFEMPFGCHKEIKNAVSWFITLESMEKKLALPSAILQDFLMKVKEREIRMTAELRFGVMDVVYDEIRFRGEKPYID